MKVITKSIPIYYGYLRIVVTKNFKKAFKKLKVDDEGINLSNYGAFTGNDITEEGYFRYTVFIKPDIEPDLIAHEVVHLVNRFCIDHHIKLSRKKDENQAYITAWFVREIHKSLKLK